MGWTGMGLEYCEYNANGTVNKHKTMTHELESWGTEVIQSAMAGGNWYGVVRERDGRMFLLICLININKSLGEFMYKDMTDTVGPYEKECPKAILDLADRLCPCTDEYDSNGWARAWRAECREAIRVKNSPTAFKNVKAGEAVLWHVPEDSYLTMNGERIAGTTLRLTKVKGRRTWIHQGLWNTRIPTKYVNPKDCELA